MTVWCKWASGTKEKKNRVIDKTDLLLLEGFFPRLYVIAYYWIYNELHLVASGMESKVHG